MPKTPVAVPKKHEINPITTDRPIVETHRVSQVWPAVLWNRVQKAAKQADLSETQVLKQAVRLWLTANE